MEQFLEFVKNDKHYSKYYDAIYILFHTGLRISEFCGLTIQDIDMKERIIHVHQQLQRLPNMQYLITETKTTSGARNLPMTPGVYETFQRILKNRKRPKVEPMVDKQIGFLFLDKNGMPKVSDHWQGYLQRMVAKYNRTHKIQMIKITPHVCRHSKLFPKMLRITVITCNTPGMSFRMTENHTIFSWIKTKFLTKHSKHAVNRYNSIFKVQMPKITPHICRHTYCSNQAKAGMNPKTLQYLMGHSDIGVTMNTYTHLGLDDAKNEMIRMEELEQARKEVDKAEGKKPMKQNMFKVV